MVRKRISKKYAKIESEDESDSDDFYEDPDTDDAAPKKYSLRQRRGANFSEDFDYDLVEETENTPAATTKPLRSDDEDFDVENADEEEEKAGTTSTKPRRPDKKTIKVNTSTTNCTITKYKDRELEPEIPKDKQSSEDMIDFEDVIRADILVNKSRIDYDSIIEKTEIKVERKNPEDIQLAQPTRKSPQKATKLNKTGTPGKKRGRKSKKQKLEEEAAELEESYYESYIPESDNAGLPINTVLGVTESLYELAERYHMEGGTFSGEINSLPMEEPLIKENVSTESTESGFIENENDCNVTIQEPEAVAEAIETC